MNKAYDRINWDFLHDVLLKFGFSDFFVTRIMKCVSSVSFSILVNNVKTRQFVPSCGLRQGDPLSPYFFILVSQALSSILSFLNDNGICKGVAISKLSPPVSHFLFADDCFIFNRFKPEDVWILKWVLSAYCV